MCSGIVNLFYCQQKKTIIIGLNKSVNFVDFVALRKEEFEYNGYKATVLFPDNFNGKWVWKTGFFYAFD